MALKIAYLVHLNLGPSSGVSKKIASQIKLWKKLGVEIFFCVITRRGDVANFVVDVGGNPFFYYGGAYSLGKLRAMHQATREILFWNPDVVYLRRDLVYPAYLRLASKFPLVQEVNSDELAELRLYSRAQYLYHKVTRRFLDHKTQGWVFVTRELLSHSYFSRLPGRKAVIANGVSLDAFPHLPVSRNDVPTLVFMGYPAPWHGVDKILFLAEQFPQWRFHLIGVSPKDVPQAPSNVYLHGPMTFSEYLPILAQSHVALGTLALHRKGMREASPLKVREYLALGLPVIIGYRDTDFPCGAPFLLEIPNEENNVRRSLENIQNFVEKWKDRRVPREAVAHLDLHYKEKERILFLKEVSSRGRYPSFTPG
ncbi:glycosyltransferase family 4 protein [Rhodothermus marinus]|uniref:glycosyltransferase family 4 protein n=1 Tax=Rhodothermus marinus TaxID=29549 RepID=UPI001374ACD4|nr:glycosyltransferase family 4 protein [Rhodothermus marinus]